MMVGQAVVGGADVAVGAADVAVGAADVDVGAADVVGTADVDGDGIKVDTVVGAVVVWRVVDEVAADVAVPVSGRTGGNSTDQYNA